MLARVSPYICHNIPFSMFRSLQEHSVVHTQRQVVTIQVTTVPNPDDQPPKVVLHHRPYFTVHNVITVHELLRIQTPFQLRISCC